MALTLTVDITGLDQDQVLQGHWGCHYNSLIEHWCLMPHSCNLSISISLGSFSSLQAFLVNLLQVELVMQVFLIVSATHLQRKANRRYPGRARIMELVGVGRR